MAKIRVNPGAVCRQLLTHLQKNHNKLSNTEEERILFALRNCGVTNATDRMIASLSRQTIEKLLESM